jgi:glycosyltransferase involved in cell wall biosynthesis
MLKNCVESVRSQAFEDWELVISDNGSEDGTRDYLATLIDPRIRIFYQEHNLGINGNVNFLISNARAPISQFLCHDDNFVEPGSLSRILSAWSAAPAEIGFIRSNWNQTTVRSALEAYAVEALPKRIEPRDSDLFFFIFGCIPGNISNISVRTRLIENMGGFDQQVANVGDFDFWSRTARQSPFLLEAANVTQIRFHAGQASKYLNRRGESISQLYAIVENLFDRLKKDFPVEMLRLHATLTYDAMQRWIAVRRLVSERSTVYLTALAEQTAHRELFLRFTLRWMTFLLSGGGRWGQTLAARWLLARRRRSSLGEARATP